MQLEFTYKYTPGRILILLLSFLCDLLQLIHHKLSMYPDSCILNYLQANYSVGLHSQRLRSNSALPLDFASLVELFVRFNNPINKGLRS